MALIPEIRTSFPLVSTSQQGTFVAANSFIWPGTNVIGSHISSARIIGGREDATSGTYRLFDTTNNQVIASVVANTAVYPAIIDLGAVQNLPAGEAIFELQITRAAGSGVQSVAASYCEMA